MKISTLKRSRVVCGPTGAGLGEVGLIVRRETYPLLIFGKLRSLKNQRKRLRGWLDVRRASDKPQGGRGPAAMAGLLFLSSS
jgi:hypothetical protein